MYSWQEIEQKIDEGKCDIYWLDEMQILSHSAKYDNNGVVTSEIEFKQIDNDQKTLQIKVNELLQLSPSYNRKYQAILIFVEKDWT